MPSSCGDGDRVCRKPEAILTPAATHGGHCSRAKDGVLAAHYRGESCRRIWLSLNFALDLVELEHPSRTSWQRDRPA